MKRFPIQDLKDTYKLAQILSHAREDKVEIVSEGNRKGKDVIEVYHLELYTRR